MKLIEEINYLEIEERQIEIEHKFPTKFNSIKHFVNYIAMSTVINSIDIFYNYRYCQIELLIINNKETYTCIYYDIHFTQQSFHKELGIKENQTEFIDKLNFMIKIAKRNFIIDKILY